MANWCSNYVVIHGHDDKVSQVMDEIKRLKTKCDETNHGVTAINEGDEDRYMFDIYIIDDSSFECMSKWAPSINSLRYFATKYGVTIHNRYHEPGMLIYGKWQCDGDGNESDIWLDDEEYEMVEYNDETELYSYNGRESDCDVEFLEEILNNKINGSN